MIWTAMLVFYVYYLEATVRNCDCLNERSFSKDNVVHSQRVICTAMLICFMCITLEATVRNCACLLAKSTLSVFVCSMALPGKFA